MDRPGAPHVQEMMAQIPLVPVLSRIMRQPPVQSIGRTGRVFAGLLLLVPLASCATKADVRDLQDSITELHAQQNALLREMQRDQDAQGDSIRVITRSLQEIRAETLRRMTNMEDHLLRIQELTGLSQQQLAGMREQLDRERAMAGLGGGPGAGIPFPGTDAPGGAGGSAEEIYFASLAQYQRGGLTTARMGFEEVVENFPGDPLAPEARYLLADMLVDGGQLDEAIEAFLEIPEYHPDAPRVPDALYRAAMLHREQGEDSDARALLERVVNTWPDTGAADLAREALAGLN